MTAESVVDIQGVCRSYSAGDVMVQALTDADVTIARGEYAAVVGPSGSGKSTLLNIVGLIDRPTDGRYLFDGIDTSQLSEGERASLRSSGIGFVFQSFHLLAHRSVLENVLLSAVYNGMPRSERIPAAENALNRVGLGHRIDFLPTRLSGGERQRVAIARAIVTKPALLLCDEPTGNLDTATGQAVLALFGELQDDGLTLIVVTHDELVSRHADRIVTLRDGRVDAS